MNERQLSYFIVIAEEKNLGRAAARLPLSMSALSRQMQSLEEELGTVLFNRTGSGLELTSGGETLLARARMLRDQFEITRREVQRTGTQVLGKLNVGGFGAVSLIYLPQILKAFKDSHPDVEGVVHTGPATMLFEALRQGNICAYFDRVHKAPEGCATELAFSDAIAVALPEEHPLCAQAEIRLEDLRDQPMIGRQDERNHPPELRRLLDGLDFSLKIVQRVQDMVTSATMVGSGLGIALLAASVQRLNIAKVVFRPLRTDVRLSSDIYCVYRQDDDSPLLRALLHVVRAHREDAEPGA
jgi:LysR family transcriptional regulator, benzoate and cis,cis-muconate-responsive activator of ben and cat genes